MKKNLTQDDKINLWLEALESGEYKQGQGLLCINKEYCCLGVLCEVAIKNGLKIEVEGYDNGEKVYDGENTILTNTVKNWIGLNSCSGDYGKDKQLTADNDTGDSFKKIAKTIRKNKKTLFNLTSAK